MPPASPRSLASAACSFRPMPESARLWGCCARRWRMRWCAVGAPAEGELAKPVPLRRSEPKPRAQRPLFDPQAGEFQDVPIYWRSDLDPGTKIAGPAVIAEDDTSTVISPLFEARLDKFGYIALHRRED